MTYEVYTIKYRFACCTFECFSTKIAETEDPLKLVGLISNSSDLIELSDSTAKYRHGENPILIWDIRDKARPCERVFAWRGPNGAAQYLGVRKVA